MIVRNIRSLAHFSPDKMGKVTLASGEKVYAGLNCFEPGQEHKAHTHPGQDKLYVVLEGEGSATVGDQQSTVSAGDLILAPAEVPHGLANTGTAPLVVLVILAPPPGAK